MGKKTIIGWDWALHRPAKKCFFRIVILGISITEVRETEIISEDAPCINIEQRTSVKDGVNERLAIENDFPAGFHDILIIKISRFVEDPVQHTSLLKPTYVKINTFLEVEGSLYQLRGISYHNSDTKIGHFLSIVFKDNKTYFINDSFGKTNCPTRLNDDVIETKADVLFYERVNADEVEANMDKWLSINDLRKLNKKKDP